jgi:hypothetical protein
MGVVAWMSELKFKWQPFEDALTLRIATSAKLAEEVLKQQARGIFRNVISITPPGHEGVKAGTRGAAEMGKAKVAGDIAKLYGTPSAAFDEIEKKNPADARAFWAVKRTRPDAAADIVRQHTGTWYGPFDGGKLHAQRFVGGRVKGKKTRPILYVSEPKALKDYVKSKQARVHFLAAGWKEIANKLGLAVPGMIAVHGAPSAAAILANMERIVIRAVNELSYASDADLNRRVQWAIDAQTGAMQRQWKEFMEKQFSKII